MTLVFTYHAIQLIDKWMNHNCTDKVVHPISWTHLGHRNCDATAAATESQHTSQVLDIQL